MMQWIDDPQGTYGCRLVCTGADIDEAMEERYLSFYKGTKYDIDHPAFDIERFIDEALRRDDVEYEPEAADLGINVLGMTRFNPDGSRLISISAGLYRQKDSLLNRGRFRFTCAHEIFHAVFHRRLFRRDGRIICFGHQIQEDMIDLPQTLGDFTEWQANRGAAGLLMPHSIFRENVKRIRATFGSINQDILIQSLSNRFDVSKKSVQIRLKTLGLAKLPDDDLIPEHDGIDSYKDYRER